MYVRICKTCKKEFLSYYKENKIYKKKNSRKKGLRGEFCSVKCQSQSYIGKGNPNWNSKEYKCVFCKKLFFRSSSLVKNVINNFCTKKCYHAFQSLEKFEKKCPICNSIFITSKSEIEYGYGKYCSKSCSNRDRGGIRSPSYIDGRTPQRMIVRKSFLYQEWRRNVYERDEYTCQICGDNEGGNLHANHIRKFSDYPELRLEISNGITLCEKCHIQIVTYHEQEWESYFNFNLQTRGFIPDEHIPQFTNL